ncbi:MAG: photosynthetic complex assembly protein PuhC [Pseudomonadota bacterium]
MTDQTQQTPIPQRIPMKREGELVPRMLLRLMILLALSSLALVTLAVLTDRPHVGVPQDGPIAAERLIILDGDRSGAVRVRAADGTLIADMSERQAGFISVIWRGLDRKRFVAGTDPAAPIRLVRFEDGRVAIIDPDTGWRTDLNAFGTANKAAFDGLID